MSFIREIRGDILIETVDLKRATALETDEFREILLKDINEGWRKIIVNLERCSFMDSTFLGSMVIALKVISKLGGDLRISGARGDSQAIMELTGTSRVFKAYSKLKEAIASFDSDD